MINKMAAALSAFFVARLNNAGKRKGALIEQLKEEGFSLNARLNAQEELILKLQEEVFNLNANFDVQEELILNLNKESMDSSVYVEQLQYTPLRKRVY